MNDAATLCYFGSGLFEKEQTKLTITALAIFDSAYAVVINLLSLTGICLVYKRDMTRTTKLLCLQFVINLMIAFVAMCVSLYPFIDVLHQYWFTFVLPSIIACLTLGSSINLLTITIDRYLLIVRGRFYLKWKKNFVFIYVLCIGVCISFSLLFYSSLKMLGCGLHMIVLCIFLFLMTTMTVTTIIFNTAMMRYVTNKISTIDESQRNRKRKMVRTVFFMLLSAGFCQSVLVFLITAFITFVWTNMSYSVGSEIVLIVFYLLLVFMCGTIPLTYVLRNRRIVRALFWQWK